MLQDHIRVAQTVLPCRDFATTLAFFTGQLGFRVNMIVPADAPAVAVISGHGTLLRLEADAKAPPSQLRLRLLCDAESDLPRELVAPDGTRIELVSANPPMVVPEGEQAFILSRNDDPDAWGTGRAGMQYRDLIPGRLGGRYIASHIRIPTGGPVPDYVHFHKVRFQMIFCKAGWAKLVYEDQGEPFLLKAGDCVLQPPEIRHRVLESSDGLEVVEIGCPAVHETFADHNMALPTGRVLPDRAFGGQLFVRHIAAETAWRNWRADGFEARDTGIGAATNGLAQVEVVRPQQAGAAASITHQGDFWFIFMLKGAIEISAAALGSHRLGMGDSCVIPRGTTLALGPSADAEWLDVTLPR
jgi:quercetin dioxygenase-like cupin family protein